MIKSNAWIDSRINRANLEKLNTTQSLECEKRLIELYELALESAGAAAPLFDDGLGVYEVYGTVFENAIDDTTISDVTSCNENRGGIESYLASLGSNDKAAFSQHFVSALARLGKNLEETEFLTEGGNAATVVYVKNKLADEAYDVFSQDLSDPRVFYASDFKEAVRAVARGKADYCLLPLEEKGGARIPSISAMLFAEDLKINSVTPVFGFDGSADMKYALVSTHFTVPEVKEDSDRYLEIRIPTSSSQSIAELISAATYLGISVYRLNSSTYYSDDGELPYLSAVFSVNGRDFCSLLTYLTLFFPSYTAVGIYDNLE